MPKVQPPVPPMTRVIFQKLAAKNVEAALRILESLDAWMMIFDRVPPSGGLKDNYYTESVTALKKLLKALKSPAYIK
jgi:hypothetical protein